MSLIAAATEGEQHIKLPKSTLEGDIVFDFAFAQCIYTLNTEDRDSDTCLLF